jgi:hypothetical protein
MVRGRRRLRAIVWVVSALSVIMAGTAAAAPRPRYTADLGVTAGFGRFAVDGARGEVFVSEPMAGAVAVLSRGGRLRATVRHLPGAYGLAVSGRYLYVAAQKGGFVARIDLAVRHLSARRFVSRLAGPKWLTITAGRLWVGIAPIATGASSVVAVNLRTRARRRFGGAFYGADMVATPTQSQTLYMAEAEEEPTALHRYSARRFPPRQTAALGRFGGGAWQNMAVSSDGTRLESADGSGGFIELCSRTLHPDGVVYPGGTYPAAVATAAPDLLATGLTGYDSPNLRLYRLDARQPYWTATTTGSQFLWSGGAVALAPGGQTLYAAVQGPAPEGPTLLIETYSLPRQRGRAVRRPCPPS